jgi:hypothetical protein
LPALIRGKRLVVAGDEKQMPPSHFFASSDLDDDDGGDDGASAVLAAQSILDVARVAFPGTMLCWHYRSRHEELITFSNHAFYAGRLVTAPPADFDLLECEGMHYERVDGLWKEQTNPIEAERTVALVLNLLEQTLPNGSRPSLGVVTFNQKQQALIQSLLDSQAVTDARARAILGAEWERDPSEALFVKNLENVQGDERDIIVFSTAYGPTEAGGKVAARFGPLGVEGGENRLNVAVTRARYGIFVVSSFWPEALEVTTTKHVGPKLLRLYLEYARRAAEGNKEEVERVLAQLAELSASAGLRKGAMAMRDQRIGLKVRDALASRLEEQGLMVARDFGIGPYRLDLAVRNPEGEARWACGVDCSRFLETADAVQRDVTEPAFWRRAGWRLFRVSPAQWLERREAVVAAVVKAVTAAS